MYLVSQGQASRKISIVPLVHGMSYENQFMPARTKGPAISGSGCARNRPPALSRHRRWAGRTTRDSMIDWTEMSGGRARAPVEAAPIARRRFVLWGRILHREGAATVRIQRLVLRALDLLSLRTSVTITDLCARSSAGQLGVARPSIAHLRESWTRPVLQACLCRVVHYPADRLRCSPRGWPGVHRAPWPGDPPRGAPGARGPGPGSSPCAWWPPRSR